MNCQGEVKKKKTHVRNFYALFDHGNQLIINTYILYGMAFPLKDLTDKTTPKCVLFINKYN